MVFKMILLDYQMIQKQNGLTGGLEPALTLALDLRF